MVRPFSFLKLCDFEVRVARIFVERFFEVAKDSIQFGICGTKGRKELFHGDIARQIEVAPFAKTPGLPNDQADLFWFVASRIRILKEVKMMIEGSRAVAAISSKD
jgi:hypothetical protein